MAHSDPLCAYHPLVAFGYFAVLLTVLCLSMHPILLLIALVFGAWYLLALQGRRALGILLKAALPLFLFTAVLNPLLSHQGKTVLGYLPGGNPLTLESIYYGLAAASLLCAVLTWFACFSVVITTDKWMFLFGRILPAISLLLSMTLRFVPKFTERLKTVRETQAMFGRATEHGKLTARIRHAVACFSIVVTWSLENAIETADSMKSRGYGTAKRTAYHCYRWTERDKRVCCLILFCAVYLLASGLSGGFAWRYFPGIGTWLPNSQSLPTFLLWSVFCALPIILRRKEKIAWKPLNSAT